MLTNFALIPSLNEMTCDITSRIAAHAHALISPRHARRLLTIELILAVLVDVLKVLDERVRVVLADPIVVAHVALLGQLDLLVLVVYQLDHLFALGVHHVRVLFVLFDEHLVYSTAAAAARTVPTVVDVVVESSATLARRKVRLEVTRTKYVVERDRLIANHVL